MFDFSFNNIIHSNLINFSVMAAIIAWLCIKFDVAEKIEELRKNTENKIITSEQDKEKAAEFLHNTEKSVENLGQEIEEIKNNAQTSAQNLADKIIEDAKSQIDKLEQNTQKNINAQTAKVQDELKQEISTMTIESAKEQIEQKLKADINLHKKLIDKSIEDLDRIKI